MNNKEGFMGNLGKVYAIYTGGFLGFVVVLAILEQLGVSNTLIGYAFIFLTIGIYATIGILARTEKVSEYYVAGRKVPPIFNGMATGADWMSGASFVGMAGSLYILGYDGFSFVLGWTGGYILVAVLLAPYLRKFGAYTVPDFLGERYGGNLARIVGILILFACSFTYVTAQIYATGIISSRFLGIPFEIAVFIGLCGILVCSMLGGMRAVTWTQVAQYIILIIAYLVPVVLLSIKVTGIPLPQLMYGSAVEQITALEPQLGITKSLAFATPFTHYDQKNFFLLIFCLMAGTASLPHVLMRFFTTPSVKAARTSVGWSLLFIFLLYFTAPSYAAFAKLEIYSNVIGQQIASLPEWVNNWSNVAGLLKINDLNGDGILQYAELSINRDIIVLATPEIAGLPYVVAGLVSAGGLAAALSTADGLLLAIANAFSHDIYYKMVNPTASSKTRLVVARIILIVVAILAAALASTKPSDILSMVAMAFSIAASGLFAPLVLGIWWKRTNAIGAVTGMVAGFSVCMYYIISTHKTFGIQNDLWFGVNSISAGSFGIPISFITIILVSLLTPAPSSEVQDMVERVRIPAGDTIIKDKDAVTT